MTTLAGHATGVDQQRAYDLAARAAMCELMFGLIAQVCLEPNNTSAMRDLRVVLGHRIASVGSQKAVAS